MDFLETTQILALPVALLPRVLIVDDDPLLCERLEALVESAGFQVRAVSNGAAALAALRKDGASIVITDLHMPDMDGLTLCRTVRAERFDRYIYMVLLTAQDAETVLLEGLAAGADDFVSKRVSPAQLIARLRTAQRILGLEQSLRNMIEEKSRLATTDALTGASNRRYFTRHLGREIQRSRRDGLDVSLLLLDIDHFKQINDRYGHAVGDEVLREFARRISASLPRKSDWHARLGGEEFAIVLGETAVRDATEVAEHVCKQIAGTAFTVSCGSIPVTVSIGVSGTEVVLPPSEASVDHLLEIADRCLYASKDAGRNRVTAAQRHPPT